MSAKPIEKFVKRATSAPEESQLRALFFGVSTPDLQTFWFYFTAGRTFLARTVRYLIGRRESRKLYSGTLSQTTNSIRKRRTPVENGLLSARTLKITSRDVCLSILLLSAQRQSSSAPFHYFIACKLGWVSQSSSRHSSPFPERYACLFLAGYSIETCGGRLRASSHSFHYCVQRLYNLRSIAAASLAYVSFSTCRAKRLTLRSSEPLANPMRRFVATGQRPCVLSRLIMV